MAKQEIASALISIYFGTVILFCPRNGFCIVVCLGEDFLPKGFQPQNAHLIKKIKLNKNIQINEPAKSK